MKSVDPEERVIFLLLFYRERLLRFAGRLKDQNDSRLLARYRHERYQFKEYDVNIKQISQYLNEIERRAEDETRCNDICKSMYFCSLKRGHRGQHCEDGWLRW